MNVTNGMVRSSKTFLFYFFATKTRSVECFLENMLTRFWARMLLQISTFGNERMWRCYVEDIVGNIWFSVSFCIAMREIPDRSNSDWHAKEDNAIRLLMNEMQFSNSTKFRRIRMLLQSIGTRSPSHTCGLCSMVDFTSSCTPLNLVSAESRCSQ